MNNQIRLVSILLVSIAFACGCEKGPKSGDEFYITPATAELAPGATVVFTAVGGHEPFVWTVGNSADGQISSSNGQSVTYMALLGAGSSQPVDTNTIAGSVTNVVSGVMNTITVTDSGNWTASAVITQH